MKKIFYSIGLLAITVFGCEPLEETYKDLDAVVSDPTAKQVIELEFTEDDYKWLNEEFGIAANGRIESDELAREFIPERLDNLFPHLGDGSSITVYYEGTSFAVSEEAIGSDEISAVIPEAGEYDFFNDDYPADEYLPEVLLNTVNEANAGDIIHVEYNFADVAYEDANYYSLLSEGFDDNQSLEKYTTYSEVGDKTWVISGFGGESYAQMNGYSSGAKDNVDWLVIPSVNLPDDNNINLIIEHAINFAGDAVIGEDIAVKVSTDFAGDVTTATWTPLTLDEWPEGNSYDFVTSTADLSAYSNQEIAIAFYYKSTTGYAARYDVNDITIAVGEPFEISTFTEYYTFDGLNWSVLDDPYYHLTVEDYDAMGAPGRYNNFDNDVRPENYLPQFLSQKYPYAQEGDEMIVLYDFYSGGNRLSGSLYTFSNGSWSEATQVIQFTNEDGVWVPDNTIRYTLTTADYQKIGNNTELGTESARANLLQYGNMSTFAWSNEDILEAIGFILHENFPNSAEGQKYLVTYNTYPAGDLEMHVILNEAGEYVPVE